MTEIIRSWIIGVTIAAVIAALIECLIPNGAIKKIGKIAGGLIILLAMLRPISTWDSVEIAEFFADHHVKTNGYSTALEGANISLLKDIIEDETATYIQDKATEIGINCEVKIICKMNEEMKPYLHSSEITGELTREQVEVLTKMIETDLAISAEHQRYERIQIDEEK